VFKVELASLGYVKTLPYLVMFLMSNVGGITGDRLIQRSKYSVAAARKTVNTLGRCGTDITKCRCVASNALYTT
jgi:ACS family sodium-dependent inorganic phosphate cotransporter